MKRRAASHSSAQTRKEVRTRLASFASKTFSSDVDGRTLTKPPAERITNPSESYMDVSPRSRSATTWLYQRTPLCRGTTP